MQFKRRDMDNDIPLELTSMTDIVFLLLIFFMISTTFVDLGRHLDIQLPETKAGQTTSETQRHVIEMGVPNILQLDGQPVRMEDIPQRLGQSPSGADTRSVIIRADKRLSYGEVMTVLGLVRQVHIRDIAVAVR